MFSLLNVPHSPPCDVNSLTMRICIRCNSINFKGYFSRATPNYENTFIMAVTFLRLKQNQSIGTIIFLFRGGVTNRRDLEKNYIWNCLALPYYKIINFKTNTEMKKRTSPTSNRSKRQVCQFWQDCKMFDEILARLQNV